MSFWCLQFPPKNERKQVDLRYHSSEVEFIYWVLEETSDWKNLFELLTFSIFQFDTLYI